MLRNSVASLLLVFAPSLCAAQAATVRPAPGGVTVVRADWRFPASWRGEPRAEVLSGSSVRTETPARREPGEELTRRRSSGRLGPLDTESRIYVRRGQNEAVVEVRNDGPKQIKSVSYDFQLVNAEGGDELLGYQLRNRTTIKPGETKTLTNVVADRRAQRLSPAAGVRVEYRAVITRVEYADGTAWQRR